MIRLSRKIVSVPDMRITFHRIYGVTALICKPRDLTVI